MAAFVTFFFSGTGNTWWVAREFTRIVREIGYEGALYAIERPELQAPASLQAILQTTDAIGLAFPIYAAHMPPLMERFIDTLAAQARATGRLDRPVYNLCTMGYVNAFGPFAARRFFNARGLQLTASINLRLTNNASVPGKKANPVNDRILTSRKQKALTALRTLAVNVAARQTYLTGIGPYLLPGILIRRFARQAVFNCYQQFSVDVRRCTQCLRCVRQCPTQSIVHTETNDWHFLPTCTACFRCYNNCPTSAILINGKFADPQTYKRYHGPEENWFTLMQTTPSTPSLTI